MPFTPKATATSSAGGGRGGGLESWSPDTDVRGLRRRRGGLRTERRYYDGRPSSVVDVADAITVLADRLRADRAAQRAVGAVGRRDAGARPRRAATITVPVRAYAPVEQDAVLTFTLTGPGDDPDTDLLEELAAGDAKVYGEQRLSTWSPWTARLDRAGRSSVGTWPASLNAGVHRPRLVPDGQ